MFFQLIQRVIKCWTSPAIFAVLLVSCSVSNSTPAIHNTPLSERLLFSEPQNPVRLDLPDQPTVLRERIVNVDLALLSESAVNDRIILNLFENVFYTVVLDQKEVSSPNSFTWYAHIPELPNSHVIMVVGGNQLAANLQSKDEIYQVRYAGAEDLHVIYQIDQSAFPSEDEPRMDE